MKKFFCIVYDEMTKEVFAEYEGVEAEDFYFARHQVAVRYAEEHPEDRRKWKVDSIEE